MSRRFLLMLTVPALMLAQEKTPPMVDGRPISKEEMDAIQSVLAPQLGPLSEKREEVLKFYGMINRLSELAEKEMPKEQLEIIRKSAVAQSFMNRHLEEHPVTAEDEKKYYAAHLDDYTIAHVQALCVPIATEKESAGSKAKADELAAQLAKGSDFAALAAKYPVPQGFKSAIKKSDKEVPEVIRTPLFALESGKVTAPIAFPSGVYIFRLEKLEVKPFDEVHNEVSNIVTNAAFQNWLDSVRKAVDVKLGSN